MKVRNYQRIVYEKGELSLSSPKGPALWLEAFKKNDHNDLNLKLVLAYLSGQTLTECWRLIENQDNLLELDRLADWFVGVLRKMPLDDLVEGLRSEPYTLEECISNVPQISSFDADSLDLLVLLVKAGRPLSYSEIGYHLYPSNSQRNEIARKKYGENAAKFAAILGLVEVARGFENDPSAVMLVRPTRIGYAVERASGPRSDIVARLLFKLALFRDLVCTDQRSNCEKFIRTIELLSITTRCRRLSAFTWMLAVYRAHGGQLDSREKTESLLCQMRR